MLKSMTAYGQSATDTSVGHIAVEIHSLNRKHLDIVIALPSELSSFEIDIRRHIATIIKRGKITVSISVDFVGTLPLTITPNIPLARQLKEAWGKLAKSLDFKMSEADYLQILTKESNILIQSKTFEEEETYKNALLQGVDAALIRLTAMKEKEGKAIYEDFIPRLNRFKGWISEISDYAQESVAKCYDKLKQRIESILPEHSENEERLLREICLYSEKVDISEEITRLQSHLYQFNQLLQAGRDVVGKTLEFLLIEMHREINTIGSKAAHLEISKRVVDIKSELERIKEQTYNIE